MIYLIKDTGGHTVGYFDSLEEATRFVMYVRANDGRTFTIKNVEKLDQTAPVEWNPVWEYRVQFRNLNYIPYISEDVYMEKLSDVCKEYNGCYYVKIYSERRMTQQESREAIKKVFMERFGGEM